MDFKNAMVTTRTLFKIRSEDHMKDDRMKPDPWMLRSRFKKLFDEQDLLFSEGSVVWGTLVQANGNLFYPGMDDHPAVILYSLDEIIDSNPKIIKKVAKGLYKIKGKKTQKDVQEFADMLASERSRDWSIPVPLRISKNIQCFYTTALIYRGHLPRGYLKNRMFPYLVCPEKTKVGTILPSQYWSKIFRDKYW